VDKSTKFQSQTETAAHRHSSPEQFNGIVESYAFFDAENILVASRLQRLVFNPRDAGNEPRPAFVT